MGKTVFWRILQTNQAYMSVFTPPHALKCVLNYFFHTKTDLSLNAQIGCLEFFHTSLLFLSMEEK